MKKAKQLTFEKTNWKHRYCHGGILRNKRSGRTLRPLSSKQGLHIVLKAQKELIPTGFRIARRFSLVHQLLRKYSKRFFIKIEAIGISGDHIHLLIRFSKRSQCQKFLRVLPGQIAQQFQKENLVKIQNVTDTISPKKLWKFRPFSRVVNGWRAFKVAMAYVLLNEKEACGQIPYKKQRLRGLSSGEWKILWS